MTQKETMVYEAVRDIINRRKANNRSPECALLREVNGTIAGRIPNHELTRILMLLVRDGYLQYRPTANDQSYYTTIKQPLWNTKNL